jgi:hypothetical protein
MMSKRCFRCVNLLIVESLPSGFILDDQTAIDLTLMKRSIHRAVKWHL